MKCEADVVLAWSVLAKNSLSNVNVFFLNQLVISFNPNTTTLLNDYPPALKSGTSFDIIYKTMQALHKAKEEFIKNECIEKIRCTL